MTSDRDSLIWLVWLMLTVGILRGCAHSVRLDKLERQVRELTEKGNP